MTFYTGGGAFCDGYILGIIAIALQLLTPQLKLTPVMTGLVGSAALAGLFFGSLIFGYVTDIIGRKIMFVLNLVAFVVGSVLQFWITDATQLIALRLFLGIAVGADYPIATSLLAEFTPKKYRGMLLGTLVGLWWIGFVAAYAVGAWMVTWGPNSWRWMLASSAVPAAILLIARLDCPESPRWLMEKGRVAQARMILDKYFGENVDIEVPERPTKTSYLEIFRKGYGSRTIFCSLFWVLQVAPGFAISTFIPKVLANFHVAQGSFVYVGTLIIGAFYIVGMLPGVLLVDRIGRRPVILWPCIGQAVLLAGLGRMANAKPWAILLTFSIYAVLHTGTSVVQWIYPNELFPTEIRATAVGFAAAMSRLGAFWGTFFMPLILSTFGNQSAMYFNAGLYALGFVVSYFMAPETANLTLAQAASVKRVSTST
jgi:putative MFS transporter